MSSGKQERDGTVADQNGTSVAHKNGMVANLVVWLLRAYQALISPLLGQNCRFHPTCSRYAIDAIAGHGAARGSWLALKRVSRCHPFNDGGLDPVP